jgi:endo-1,4-beta-xylanase
MRLQSASTVLFAASAAAQLDVYAKRAGLEYFGSATDTPGQRERAGLEAAYPQYNEIFADPEQFSQTTPTNGQKVRCPKFITCPAPPVEKNRH